MLTVPACPLTFDADTHEYVLNGAWIPGVTYTLKRAGYIRLDGIPADVLEQARQRGADVHKLLHYALEDDLDESSIDEAYLGYLLSARSYLDKHVARVLRAEMRVWSERHYCAGTLDLLALHRDGDLSVDDFKTGDPADVAADLQTAAYEAFLLEMGGRDRDLGLELRACGRVVKRRSLRLFADGRMARETPYTDHRDFMRFLSALSVVHDQAKRPAPLAWDDER